MDTQIPQHTTAPADLVVGAVVQLTGMTDKERDEVPPPTVLLEPQNPRKEYLGTAIQKNDWANNIVTRLAIEGVPINAIARVTQRPVNTIRSIIDYALSCGMIGGKPKEHWTVGSTVDNRKPEHARVDPYSTAFVGHLMRLFKLSQQQAIMLQCLLRHDLCYKETLHSAIQREDPLVDPTDKKIVDVVVCKLRARIKALVADPKNHNTLPLAPDPMDVILTIWGKGYYIDAPTKKIFMDFIGLHVPGLGGFSASKADDTRRALRAKAFARGEQRAV